MMLIRIYKGGSLYAPVELHKTNPRLCKNWSILASVLESILASVMDTPFPYNLEIAGSQTPLSWLQHTL